MGAFQVPQFIDVEDKIIGPLTLRQFLFVAGAALIIFLSNSVLQFWLWIIVSIFVALVGFTLAFLKINGQNFSRVAFNAIKYMIRPRLYVWQRGEIKKVVKQQEVKSIEKKSEEKERLTPEELERWARKNVK